MMLAHWWDAEHWQGDCVYFYTFLLLTFLLLFSPFFFLFPGLLALGHVVDSSNAKHIGGKEHVVLIKKRLSQAIYLFVWKLLLHFTDNMKKNTRWNKKIAMQSMEKKWPCSHLFIACLLWSKNDRFQKVNWWFAQTVVAIVVRNTHRVDSIDVSFGLQEPFVRCHGHDVSSLAGCWTLARRLCLIFYLFLADRAVSVLSLLSVFLAFALGVFPGLSLYESSKVIVFLQFWQKCANVRQTLTFPFSSSFFRSSLSSLSASSTC